MRTDPVGDSLRTRVPLMLALWGFLFVLVAELVIWRVRGNKPATKPAEPPPDDAEKLLNELLSQAEAAAEARGEGQGDRGKEEEDKKSEAEKAGEPPA